MYKWKCCIWFEAEIVWEWRHFSFSGWARGRPSRTHTHKWCGTLQSNTLFIIVHVMQELRFKFEGLNILWWCFLLFDSLVVLIMVRYTDKLWMKSLWFPNAPKEWHHSVIQYSILRAVCSTLTLTSGLGCLTTSGLFALKPDWCIGQPFSKAYVLMWLGSKFGLVNFGWFQVPVAGVHPWLAGHQSQERQKEQVGPHGAASGWVYRKIVKEHIHHTLLSNGTHCLYQKQLMQCFFLLILRFQSTNPISRKGHSPMLPRRN